MPTLDKTPTAAQDVVAVFDSAGTQVFVNARGMRLDIQRDKVIMTHPGESGITIADHSIIMPTEAALSVILDPENYRDVHAEIERLFVSNEVLTIQCRTRVYQRMIMTSIPHEETVAIFDTIRMVIGFKEILIGKGVPLGLSANQVSNPADVSTANRGQQPAPEQEPGSSLLWRMLN